MYNGALDWALIKNKRSLKREFTILHIFSDGTQLRSLEDLNWTIMWSPKPRVRTYLFLRKPGIAKYPLRSFLIHFSQKKSSLIITSSCYLYNFLLSYLIVGLDRARENSTGMEWNYPITGYPLQFFIYYQIRRKVTGPEPDSPLTRISGPTLTEY